MEALTDDLVIAMESLGDLTERHSLDETQAQDRAFFLVGQSLQGVADQADAFLLFGVRRGRGGGRDRFGPSADAGRFIKAVHGRRRVAAVGLLGAEGVEAEPFDDSPQPGTKQLQGPGIVLTALELAKLLPGAQPRFLGEIGRICPGTGQAVEPRLNQLQQLLDGFRLALTGPADQLVEPLGEHGPLLWRHRLRNGDYFFFP